MSGRGGFRRGSGRKRMYASQKECFAVWRRGHRRISLDYIVYSAWVSAKIKCGYKSDSEFAGHLLSLEMRRRANEKTVAYRKRKVCMEERDGDSSAKRRRHFEGKPFATSTPVRSVQTVEPPYLSIDDMDATSDVDVTGVTEVSVNNTTYQIMNGSVILQSDAEKYLASDESASEDDFSDEDDERVVKDVLADALGELDEDNSEDSDCLSDVSDVDALENSTFVDEDGCQKEFFAEGNDVDDDDDDLDYTVLSNDSPKRSSQPTPSASASHPTPSTTAPHPTPPASGRQPTPSASGSQPTPSASGRQPTPPASASHPTLSTSASHSTPSTSASHPTPSTSPSHPTPSTSASHPTPSTSASHPTSTMSASQPTPPASGNQPTPSTSAPQPVYHKLSRLEEKKNFLQELSLVSQVKIICSLDLLLAIFKKCQYPGCGHSTATIKHHLVGTTAVITWSCPSGHKGTFSSSKDLNDIYANNIQVAASIMLSGNNFAKIEKLAKFLGLAFISDSTFYRMQRLYLIPAVNEWWSWQREQLLKDWVGKEVIVCGDGQCDSPGHTAKNLCYFLMELVSGYILEIEVRDKRHVGLTSTNMEKQALQNALQRLQLALNIVEVVTDASTTIKKMLADNFATVFHSLDIWHKAKSIRKCLAKVGHLKNMEKIQQWSDHIILHFWHCASVCKVSETTSDEDALDKMKSTWIGLLHHVCDDHEWVGGKCDHGELEEHTLPWFDRRDKDFEALQKIITDPQLLSSFEFYVRFRHTGSLECANSLSLVYTPKRCSYSYKAYKARKQLAAIDWNFHLDQPEATTKAGDIIVTRKYNQRTKEWNSKVVKVTKGYEYIVMLMARILRLRREDAERVTRNVPLDDSDPALLAPTIAPKPPPPSKELYLAKRSRFTKTTSSEERSAQISCETETTTSELA